MFFSKLITRVSAIAVASAVSFFGATAKAGSVDLCGGAAGWRAIWDVSLDPYVQIIASDCSQLANGNVFIQKSAEFTQAPVNGVFPAIPIVFMQTGPTNVSHIVIDDEIITNSTGSPWTDFHFDLLDSGDAVFNPASTAASGGGGPIGFSISPFTVAVFANANTRLDISGGVVPNGGIWFPGDGATDGQLWIDVNPRTSAPFTTFTLKETPTPEPTTLALLAIGGLLMRRRR